MELAQRAGKKAAAFLLAMTAVVLSLMGLTMITANDAKAQWNGCAFGGFGAYGAVEGVTGQGVGVLVGCDMTLEKRFVVGAEARYTFVLGDLHDQGIDHDLNFTGRAGVLITPTVLLYGHGGWARIDGGGDHLDGYTMGAGTEMKLPNSPLFLDLRWTHSVWNDAGSSSTPKSDDFMVAVKLKFGGPEAIIAPLK